MLIIGCPDRSCGGVECIKTPLDADVLAPWIEIKIIGQGTTITVGNNSGPDKNNFAHIKSFEFGASHQYGCVIEIVDEEGGDFGKFVDKLVKDNLTAQYTIDATWGWIGQSCKGKIQKKSPTHTFFLSDITVNYEGGTFKFTVEGQDLGEVIGNLRITEEIVKDIEDLPLQEAIKKLFRDIVTPPIDVKFLKVPRSKSNCIPTSQLEPWEFDGNPTRGWKARGESPISLVQSWYASFVSKDQRGIYYVFRSTNDNQGGQELIFFEDPTPDQLSNGCLFSIGTYIVNGGKYSPVIGFAPKMKFQLAFVSNTGGVIGKSSSEADQINNDAKPKTGTLAQHTTSESSEETFKPDAAKKTDQNFTAQEKANRTYPSITAELRIQGDPDLSDMFRIYQHTVSVIVINPFYLTGSSVNATWLVDPPCNSVLSQKEWRIKGVFHEIREGSYTTTINLDLPQANEEGNP